MSLTSGSRLGPYEIVAPLGAGGMGEVYRAKDTRLGRDVAVKILPLHLSQQPEVRERFEREARAISSLNHPNICTLFDVGREGDADYFVMELLDGEPLSTRLERGPMKLDEALKVAAQIADGLAAAHKQGIIHRDLKPGNIVLTRAGAKILDFGVAKLRDDAVVELATRTKQLTTAGAMVGTVQYMSPEQLEGKPVDHRADLFAFGALLYEMVTGQRAFQGQSQASVIAAILDKEPQPVSALVLTSPPALDRVVTNCLAKDPDDRWQTASDVARELRWIGGGTGPTTKPLAPAASPIPSRSTGRSAIPWIVAAIGLALGLAGLGAAMRRPKSAVLAEPITRFAVIPLEGQVENAPAVSPDGRRIAYLKSASDGGVGLWLHSLESGESRLLAGTEGARQPFWSPDGKSIAFFAQGRLKKVEIAGGSPQVLGDAADPRGGSWGSQGDILFTPTSAKALLRVAASGGTAKPATQLNAALGEQSHRWPEFLPDGRHFIFIANGVREKSGIFWASLEGGPVKRLLPDPSSARFDSRGFLVFRRGQGLMAQRFDPESGMLHGEAVMVANEVGVDPQMNANSQFSISRNGVLALRSGGSQRTELGWFDRAGKPLGTIAPGNSFREPALSPDGTRLALGADTGLGDEASISILDLRPGGQLSRLTFGSQMSETPIWSADGSSVVYSSTRNDGWAIVRKAASGVGGEEVILQTPYATWVDDWSLDGKYLILEQFNPESGADLMLLPTSGDRTMVPFRQSPANESHSSFSPDGRYVAYVSDELGTPEVFVETNPSTGSKWQVSSGGGDMPAWRRDGRELYYVSANRMLNAVAIESLAPFRMGARQSLFRLAIGSLSATGTRTYFNATQDGKRFIVASLVGESASPGFQVVLNWTAILDGKQHAD
jgi:Tol biopolymer transport system component